MLPTYPLTTCDWILNTRLVMIAKGIGATSLLFTVAEKPEPGLKNNGVAKNINAEIIGTR